MSLIINLNSRIINEKPAPDLREQYVEFQFGWNTYEAGESIDCCLGTQMRRGWMSALRAETIASLPVACAEHLGF